MRFLIVSVFALMLVACVQSPTRNTQVVDDRPGLAFELSSSAAEAYELKVDGVSYGRVGQYLDGENRLRIIDGSHVVELMNNGQVVYTQKVYLGAGSNRVLKVGSYE
ncbi:hypothetical protein FE848_02190 [Marinobacter sp. 1-3A]|uniref:hypothetical protein n=1 Tax=Marinobacter sp. 1-3A TaxID=2582920 RepID=UPI00190801E2|nr:hypothetical protein [Marinobacter sp. 1-3A]MBK1872020.1 hypothetical protein [Marinobacter sp. 1-3A]